jgi:hypothetical protein
MAKTLEKIKQLSLTDPQGAQRATDWKVWRNSSTGNWAITHALGLHRDPKRGRSHILVKHVEHTPKASKELRYKFRVIDCGVFRISDIMPEIEGLMGLNKGEGDEYIQGLLKGMERQGSDGTWWIPTLHLSFGQGVETWLGCGTYHFCTGMGAWLIVRLLGQEERRK